MNLWIRSQNGENLINNPLRIHYEIGYNEEHRIYANTYDECILMGKYTTRERALEVLAEIQKILYNNQKFINNVVVYEMPKY